MKKLLTLAAAGSLATAAMAQDANQSVVRLENGIRFDVPATADRADRPATDLAQRVAQRRAETAQGANKTAVTGTRVYNWVDALFGINPSIGNNQSFPYSWPNYRGLAVYAGNVYDTINYASGGHILHPWFEFFNDVNIFAPTEFGMKDATVPYTLDSVTVYGFYQRQQQRPNVVDTVRLAIFYGPGGTNSNVITTYDVGNTADFGVDTIRFAVAAYDSARVTATRASTAAPAVIYRNVPLTAASENDTNAFGLNRIRAAVGQAIPAGNLVGVTATFIPGENFATGPNGYDTVLLAGANNTVVPKYSMFRFRFFEQNRIGTTGQFPTYYPGSFNTGLFKLLPLSGNPTTSYRYFYFPHYFFTAASGAEFMDVDFRITSNNFETLQTLGLNSVNTNVSFDKAYPNPAQNEVRVALTIAKASDVTVSLSNAVGQVVATQSLGKVAASTPQEAVFSTTTLPNGVYFYTVEAGGARKSGRIVVAH